nr:deoxyribodipyrimidine photolyase [Candidatus Laterigemmans baculatus]
MIAFRRTRWNFALQHAVDAARRLNKPLVIFEPLRIRYRWASDRLHRFVIEGMRDNAAALQRRPVTYYPYVEPAPGKGTPLLHRLAERACLVVSDQYPGFFLPTLIEAVKDRLPARLELVDSNTVMPLQSFKRTFTVAHSYRRWMQKNIREQLFKFPAADPLARVRLPRLETGSDSPLARIQQRWPAADFAALLDRGGLAKLPIDHAVPPATLPEEASRQRGAMLQGGAGQGERRLREFLGEQLSRYAQDRNHPDEEATSRLSPYLHFGHLSPHQIVSELWEQEHWNPSQLGEANGKNRGFWNLSASAEAFLDQLLTWRELGFNMSYREPDRYDSFDSLPEWALATLERHASDPRPHRYSLPQFEAAATHDPLWNAAQRQLVREGRIHNYMRMLWGKHVLHWTQSPREALEVLVQLNNKYALDGRDPNSYSGIFWIFGRYDRAWGPRRPVFGSVRYMTSDSAQRKLKLHRYLRRYAPEE